MRVKTLLTGGSYEREYDNQVYRVGAGYIILSKKCLKDYGKQIAQAKLKGDINTVINIMVSAQHLKAYRRNAIANSTICYYE